MGESVAPPSAETSWATALSTDSFYEQDAPQNQYWGKKITCDQDVLPTHRKEPYPLEFRKNLVLQLFPTGSGVPALKWALGGVQRISCVFPPGNSNTRQHRI